MAIAPIKSLAVGKSENRLFEFKEFSIRDDKCAMKIGTDGILLGAWADCENKKNGLDIGCRTGVIAIMICQKNPIIKMTALEISNEAIKDAIINFNICKWNNNLTLYHQDLNKHIPTKKYDFIVTNPPFYNDGFKPKNKEQIHKISSGTFGLLLYPKNPFKKTPIEPLS